MSIGVYKITSPSGKVYIGSSVNITNRLYSYKNINCKNQRRLYSSLKKYGYEAHKVEIVELCDADKLYELEHKWGMKYDVLGENGLNCVIPSIGEKRRIVSEETRRNQSEKMKGKKQSEETRKKNSESKKGSKCYWYGKKKNDAYKEYMRSIMLGNQYGKGYKLTEEQNRAKSERQRYITIKFVKQLTLNGDFVQLWISGSEAGRRLKIQRSHISMVAQGKRPTAGGYKWEYLKKQ